MADSENTLPETSTPEATPIEFITEKPKTSAGSGAKSLGEALRKGKQTRKAGRPKGKKDAPDTDRQVAKRETEIRKENKERDRELLKQAESDPSLKEWIDIPPEGLAPVYDLLSATITMTTGLPGLLKEPPEVKTQWCVAAAGVLNHYKFDLFGHPVTQLVIVSAVAAGPSIQAYRVLTKIRTLMEAGKTKTDSEVVGLIQEAKRLGVEIESIQEPSTNA